MVPLQITTKQYLTLMRALATAMTLDDHVAEIRGDKGDKELSLLWETLMDRADDFGMSFPDEKEEGEHWGDGMFEEADEDLHALMDDEFWHILADRLAESQHAKTCPKPAGEHDEACFHDVQERAAKLEEGLDERVFEGIV